VRAALAVAAVVSGLTPGGEPLHVRIGIATGLVVIGEPIGSGDSRQQTAVGETPNLAARLQGLAGPDQVVIDAATRRQIGGLLAAGTAEVVKRQGSGGVTVHPRHPGGLVTLYAHLGNLVPAIAEGKRNVAAGEVLGHVARTGVSYGTHLFFAVLENGQAVDPLRRPARRLRGRYRQPGHPGRREPHARERPSRCRLRHRIPDHDHRQDNRRAVVMLG
jgi:hypothetical protein